MSKTEFSNKELKGPNVILDKRKLNFTVDGIHFNTRAAEALAGEIDRKIMKSKPVA